MQSNKAEQRNLKINNIRQTLKAVPIIRKTTMQIETKLLKIRKRSDSLSQPLFDKDLADSASQTSQDEQPDSLFNDSYTLGDKIGEGAHGVVRKCFSKQSGRLFAVKTFKVDRQHIIFLKHNFIDIKKLQHPNIIGYKALFFQMQSEKCHLVMDYLPNPDLMNINIKTEHKLKELTHQLIQTLFFIHSHRICHRDIKPENILYDQIKNKIILIDFGISRKLTKRGIKRDMLTLTGTPYYRAPEMFQGGGYDELVDLWALGVTIFKLMAGITPFESEYHSETISNIMKGQVIFPPEVQAKYSRQARMFISRLLKRRIERITAKQALNDLWFIDLQKKVDEYTRSMNIDEKLQKHPFHASTNVELLQRTSTGTEQQLFKLAQILRTKEETIKSLKQLDEYAQEQDSKIFGCPDDEFGLE